MAYYPISTTYGASYAIVGPDGVRASFNDPLDPDYVGVLTEVTGLDGADIRESAFDLTESDGGVHGSFYLGRRPITMSGSVFGHATIREREIRLDRARRATLALRGDSTLTWKPMVVAAGDLELFVPVRRQQPFRESGNWVKTFQIALVSQYAQIFGSALKTAAPGVATENQGNYPAYPLVNITGSSTDPTVSDGTRVFRTTGLTLAGGEVVQFDMLNHTGVFTAGARSGLSANRYIDWATTAWPYVLGTVTFSLGGGGTATIPYRDTWA